jgi:hypothetical protein
MEAAIRTHVRNERILEDTLIKLCECPDFTIKNALRLFGQKDDPKVTFSDLLNTYKELDIEHTEEEVRLLMLQFDRNETGILELDDFQNMFLPYDEKTRRLVGCRPFLNLGDERRHTFCLKTMILFNRVLKLLLDNEVKAEAIRHKLSRSEV